MPKRACPFEDDLLPQLKVHVGQRQIDNGVCKSERMKDVYDKTLNLLKEGVKTLSHKLNGSIQADAIDLLSPKSLSCNKLKPDRNLKQMILNDKLQLKLSDKKITDIQMELCGCCRIIDRSNINKCYYCDQVLCSSCLSECTGCKELFCQNCSIPKYNGEEHIMCLNCYR